jgi:hypothetical protein
MPAESAIGAVTGRPFCSMLLAQAESFDKKNVELDGNETLEDNKFPLDWIVDTHIFSQLLYTSESRKTF